MQPEPVSQELTIRRFYMQFLLSMLDTRFIGSDCEISMLIAGYKWKIRLTVLEES